MDVRHESINADYNCSVITGDGILSSIDNDSFFARAPPQAASTVCRTKARRTMPIDSGMGSFLEEMPSHFSFEIGTRPKLSNTGTKAKDKGEMPPPMENVGDWPEMDGKSSLGILNLDDMDLSSNHLLMDSPRIDLHKHAISDKKARINLMEEYKEKTTSETKKVEDMRPVPFNNNSQVSINSNTRKSESASRQGKDSPHLSETTTTKLEGSSQRLDGSSQRFDGSSSTGQDFKSDQPFARSQINTVKKNMAVPTKNDPPMLAAIRQSLFGQGTIGEEGEDGEVSVYNVEFEAEELQGLDDDFGEMNCSVGGESDEGSPVKTPTNSTPRAARYNKVAAGAVGSSVEEIVLDSIYLRPGTTGEEQSQRKLPYLSKVSLFDGGSGSGSEVDTEDELEQARKAQGMRHEAAGQAWQQGTSRPGLVGEDNRFPMTQRQSAEGDVVNSPVPGDGGGGGDGTSGSDSEDAGNSRRPNRNAQNYHGNRQMSTLHGNQGQRIRPMGDDLLSDLRFSRFPMEVDSRLSSRYLTPVSLVEDSQTAASFDVDEILGAEHEFDPGNRLEASGFNADDASALGLKVTQGSNPFAQKSSSFGSFGLGLGQGLEEGSLGRDDSAFSVEMMGSFPREDRSAHEVDWSLLQLGRSSSGILGSQEVDRMALGNRTAASGSPDRSSDGPFRQSQLLSRPNMGAYPSTSYTAPSLPTTSRTPSTGHVASQHSSMNTSERGGRTSGSSDTSGPELKKSQENAEFAVTPRVTVSQTSSIAARSDDVFKKPTMPPPKAANFSKSVVRPKSAQSKSSNVSKSTDSATSVKSSASSYVDLEYRMSLSEQACAQREGLRRVPSFGGTSEMDLTINDEEFFGVNDAQAMLDADEVEFEEEHVIRQDDAMKDTGSPNDSWAYRSVMSVARPSWMEGPGDEGAVCVRISVGSYMRGRTEALGSLSGDGNEPRPEFGMKIASPPSCKEPPGRLIEEEDCVFESTRTSGVGEYGIATPIKAASTDVQDQTLTMDSLTAESPKALDFTLSATLLGFKPNLNPGSTANATKLSMGELSMMLNNTGISMNKVVALHGSKSSKTKLPETHTNQGTESKLSPIAKKSPPKSSQLPIMKGSSLNRSFPKVGDSESSMLKSKRLRKGSSCDSRFKSGSVGDSAPEVDRPSDVSSAEKTPKNTSPRSSNQSENDLWSSPNSSSYCANNTGLFDRLDEFKISFNSGAAQQHPNLKTVEDREKTPPADGEDRKANISTNILMSKPKPKSMDEEKATKTNLVNSVNSNPTIKQISDRENLGREYSHEVLDRIYSADAHGSFQCIEQTQLDDHFTALHSRESLETEWNTIRRETVTRGDFSRISDIQIGLVPPPTAQSTPFPPSIAKFTDFSTTISSSKVCPVDAPPALKFREACCVGISRKELLPLRNPTDRWMECFIEPKFLECDGKRMSLEHFPFELRQRKFIIDPHKTFNVDVMFLPKRPGAYVAQVQVFSLSFLNRSQMKERDVVPVNISFQASAEDPWIKVSCDDGQCNSVDFGELLWGSCGEKTICIQNMGQATVPLRLAITSNKAWHCFAFEPEGGVSDVSIISGCHPPTSGQGRSIINISLPGCDQPFSYQKVKVWCRPPEKQFTKALARQPPEVFECSVDIEVDTPCSRQPKLSTLHLKATVGVCKLHTQTNLKEIHIRSSPKASERTTVRLFNAGNLSLTVSFGISDHRDVFIVSPTSLLLKPHEDGSIVITFKPNLDSMKKFVTLLLMMVQPSGPVFELQIVGEVQEAVPENLQLLCDITTLDFGGVALGKTCVKCYRLKNNNPTPVLLTAKVTDSDIRLAREADRRVEGSDTLDLEVSPTHTLPVYVMYAPLLRQHLRSKVTMRHPASGKYTVKIQGYGGVSRLHCKEDCLETTFVEGHTCFTVTSFSMDKVKDIFLTNLGDRAARVHVAVYEDLKCTECLLSGEIIVKPSELSLMDGESKKMKLVVGMKEAEFTRRQEQNSVGAALCFEYVDQVESNHPFRSKLIVGLVRGFAASGTPTTTTPLRSVRPYRPSYFSEIATDLSSRFSTTSDDMTERFSHGTESSVVERIGGWSVKPSKLVIYCSNRGQEFETFYIYNHNSVGIRFEMFWPGGNLSLTPGSGTILPRENQCIRVYPTTVTTQSPPWSGQIIVSVDRQTESILVEVKQDASATNQDIPEKNNRSLVPISSNVNLSSVGTNRLGHLEVSRTSVQFPSTRIGKCSEQTIDISNIGPETLRWLFSSFAPLYMKRKTESSKDVFRVSYKVFDFTKQFGKLNAKETLQLTVQFMPQSAGTFTQYWDLQTSSNAGLSKSTSTTQHPQHQDYIMVHLTGEGQEDDTETPRGKSDVENLLPKLPSNKYSLRLGQELMEFPCMERGNRSMLRLELKNNHMEDVKVEVTAPQPPFHVNHSSFKIQKKKYLRLPIEFQPTRPGRFTDVVKFQSSKGDNLILQLSAECRSTHLTSLS